MWIFHERLLAIAVVVLLLCSAGKPSAFARGSQVLHDDPWNSEHIDRLPPEVRSVIIRLCKHPPHAAHYFVTYSEDSHLIKLHFEHLHCEEPTTFCTGDGCLHQEYVSTGGYYRLIKSYYGRNND
jgi:hypothetical protein